MNEGILEDLECDWLNHDWDKLLWQEGMLKETQGQEDSDGRRDKLREGKGQRDQGYSWGVLMKEDCTYFVLVRMEEVLQGF